MVTQMCFIKKYLQLLGQNFGIISFCYQNLYALFQSVILGILQIKSICQHTEHARMRQLSNRITLVAAHSMIESALLDIVNKNACAKTGAHIRSSLPYRRWELHPNIS